jgi:hypothetical protein
MQIWELNTENPTIALSAVAQNMVQMKYIRYLQFLLLYWCLLEDT